MVKIGNVEIRGPLTLAPMAGVTDAPFRALCRAQGAALTCTEMVSAKALVYHDEKTKQLLWSPPDEHPAAVQIFGHEPEVMAEAAPSLSMLAGTSCTIDFTVPEGLVPAGEDGICKGKPGFAVLFDEADGNVLRRVGVLSRFEVMLSRMR